MADRPFLLRNCGIIRKKTQRDALWNRINALKETLTTIESETDDLRESLNTSWSNKLRVTLENAPNSIVQQIPKTLVLFFLAVFIFCRLPRIQTLKANFSFLMAVANGSHQSFTVIQINCDGKIGGWVKTVMSQHFHSKSVFNVNPRSSFSSWLHIISCLIIQVTAVTTKFPSLINLCFTMTRY